MDLSPMLVAMVKVINANILLILIMILCWGACAILFLAVLDKACVAKDLDMEK